MKLLNSLIAIALIAPIGCGEGSEAAATLEDKPTAAVAASGGLSEQQLKLGIGPVKEPLTLSAIDEALAATGKGIFESKCAACHKLDERYVGPELGSVLARRSPEYVMNMILNPAEMVQKHPDAKKLLGEFMMQMPFQNVSQEESRAIVEYLRTAKSETAKK